jgi:hypothetical protein
MIMKWYGKLTIAVVFIVMNSYLLWGMLYDPALANNGIGQGMIGGIFIMQGLVGAGLIVKKSLEVKA